MPLYMVNARILYFIYLCIYDPKKHRLRMRACVLFVYAVKRLSLILEVRRLNTTRGIVGTYHERFRTLTRT